MPRVVPKIVFMEASEFAPALPSAPVLDREVNWVELVAREPLLLTLAAEINGIRRTWRRVKSTNPWASFCANGKWGGYGRPREVSLNWRLGQLVGWNREDDDPVLSSSEAYEVAVQALYDMLPDCYNCGC